MKKFVENILKRVQKTRRYLELKFQKKTPVETCISFQKFFACEKFSRLAGYSFLLNSENPVNKWARLNTFLSQLAQIFLLSIYIISIVLSIREGQLYVVIENVLMSAVLLVILIKIYLVLYMHKKEICEVTERLKVYFPHFLADQKIYNVPKYWKMLNNLNIFYTINYLAVVPYFCMFPFLKHIYCTYMSIESEKEHIFVINLAFHQLQPVVYELIYIFEVWMVACAVLSLISFDLLYENLMQTLVMEFDILGQAITKISFDQGETEAVKQLKSLVDIHQELIEIAEKLEKFFSPILFINTFATIVTLCTASFLSVSGVSGLFIAKYFIFPIFIPVQSYPQCYYAQKLIDSSTSIAFAAYDLEWYSSSVEFQRLVLLIILRGQKAQTVTAWKFFDVSLETFKWIISTSYSYFSILQNMYGA